MVRLHSLQWRTRMMDCLKKYSYQRHAARGGLGPLPPDGVTQQPDGFWYRRVDIIASDGTSQQRMRRVCEDCWCDLPRYKIAPYGLVSQESEGKTRPSIMELSRGPCEVTISLQKSVCIPCYQAGYRRVFPDAPVPELDDAAFPEPLLLEESATNPPPLDILQPAQR